MIIPALYEETRQGVVKVINGWTSRATESFLTVTAHYITLVTVNINLFLAFVQDNFFCFLSAFTVTLNMFIVFCYY